MVEIVDEAESVVEVNIYTTPGRKQKLGVWENGKGKDEKHTKKLVECGGIILPLNEWPWAWGEFGPRSFGRGDGNPGGSRKLFQGFGDFQLVCNRVYRTK